MKSRDNLHTTTSIQRDEAFDLEAFSDRMHLGDAVARSAYEIFREHGSATALEVEEDWDRTELERLGRYLHARRAA